MPRKYGKLSGEDEQRILKNIIYLKNSIDQRYLRDMFMQEGLFCFNDFEEIDSVVPATVEKKTEKFLDLLSKSGADGYKVLIKALRNNGQDDVAKTLEDTPVDKICHKAKQKHKWSLLFPICFVLVIALAVVAKNLDDTYVLRERKQKVTSETHDQVTSSNQAKPSGEKDNTKASDKIHEAKPSDNDRSDTNDKRQSTPDESDENPFNQIGPIIGIDLGTTYSCVGILRDEKVEIILNELGNRITPSCVAFTENGRLIGDAAKTQLSTNPENTIFDVKRLVGRTWYEASVQHDIKFYPFKVINQNEKPQIVVKTSNGEKTFAPEEISAMVLGKMKKIAEDFLGEKVEYAVITVPAYFNDAQRQATKNAGTIAGLNVLRIINEPTAAAMAFGLKTQNNTKERNILVFDLGGGTFDVSLVLLDDGVFEVLSTNGDTHLGGEDFDHRIVEYFIKLYRKKKGKDITSDNRAIQKLKREVEKAKRTLSSEHQTRIEVDSLYDGEDFSETLTRAKFEELNMDLFHSTMKPVEKVLQDGDVKTDEIEEIILVGGSTRIPKIRQLVREFFNGKDPIYGINPDEAVAYGAAIQAGIMAGELSQTLLMDINPLTLGIETVGGVMTKIISRNSVIPTKKSETFSTVKDDQTVVNVKVYEGERTLTKDNHLLGSFDLTGIPPAPKGEPKIEVTFDIDINAILTVRAEEKGAGNKKEILIRNDRNRLSEEEITRMIKDAERFAEEDRREKEKVDARNELESYIYRTKKQIVSMGNISRKLGGEDRRKLEEIVVNTIEWLENNNNSSIEDLKGQISKLKAIVQPILGDINS